jgi:hypothetical protein
MSFVFCNCDQIKKHEMDGISRMGGLRDAYTI